MKKLIRSFGFAFKGIGYAARTQLNFRVHIVAALTAVLLGCALHVSVNEWLWIALCMVLVVNAELLNTAIEVLVDLVSPGYNAKAGHIKDISAGAVLVTAIFALLSGLVIFLPKILALIYAA